MGGDELSSDENPADFYQFFSAQYRWQVDGSNGQPLRSQPPTHTMLPDPNSVTVRLPAWSLSVVRGQGPTRPGTD